MKLQHSFTINHESIDGQRLSGTFTCKKRSIQDSARLGVRVTQLNGGMHYDEAKPGYGVDSETYSINYMIACLELGLVTKPEWFDLDELVDMELLAKVFKEVSTFENSFRMRAISSGVSSTGSEKTQDASNGSRENRTMVGYEVQASLEP